MSNNLKRLRTNEPVNFFGNLLQQATEIVSQTKFPLREEDENDKISAELK